MFAWTLRTLVIAACCASTAHAQETPQQLGLFESLGRLLQPRQEAPAAEASGQARNLAVAGKERRVALVIGNSAYPGAGALKNPVNDANDIAAKLKKLGFDVIVRTDMRHKEMLRSLTEFGDKVQTGTEALFFYAGHGMQVRGKNYLLPVDAEIRNEASASSEAVDVDQLLDKLSQARLSVVILDACRNNPFERRFRGSGQGLAQINAPTGTLIAYATAPGKVAADGDGRNGLYTAELLAAMDVPGIKIEDVFKRVRGNVVRKSNDAQTPWESSSLTGDFYFSFQGPTTANVQQMSADPEAETWAAAEDAKSTEGYQAYLDAYPQGRYAVAARIKLKGLQKPAASAAISPAPTFAPVAASSTSENPETAMWNEVKASGVREYLDAYLKQYPKGKYIGLAKVELKKLDERDKAQRAKETSEKQQAAERQRQEALRGEQVAWDEAKTTGTAASYARYLERYPKGRHAALAQAVLPKLQRKAAEREKQEATTRHQEEERQKLVAESERLKTEKAAKEMHPGKVFKDCADCPEMVMIPTGTFEMGSNDGNSDEKPVHRVKISKAFVLSKTEVTQLQWRMTMGSDPPEQFSHVSTQERASRARGCDDCPVENVNWNDVYDYLRKLSQNTGKSYRLPSEAEWEYACRAGSAHTYCGSDIVDVVAWHGSNSGNNARPVASRQPNAWGLYDMSGNVWEWTEDCWTDNYDHAPIDGSAKIVGDCKFRVLRGGSWNAKHTVVRASIRFRFDQTYRSNSIGFRLARTLP